MRPNVLASFSDKYDDGEIRSRHPMTLGLMTVILYTWYEKIGVNCSGDSPEPIVPVVPKIPKPSLNQPLPLTSQMDASVRSIAIHFFEPRASIVHSQVSLKRCASFMRLVSCLLDLLFHASMGEAPWWDCLSLRDEFAKFPLKLSNNPPQAPIHACYGS